MEQKNPKHPEDEEKHKSAYELLERQRAERAAKEAAVQAEAPVAEPPAAKVPSQAPAPIAQPEAPAAPAFIAEHTVVSGDTLSGIALKYYDSAARDKWMAIYEANKEIIGSNPGMIRVGQVFQIPRLD